MSCAWVTYANNNTFFEASLILYKSLQLVGTICDCIIMTPLNFQYTGNFPATCLSMKNLIVKPIYLHEQYHPNYSEQRYAACLNKLHIWLLTDYEKVCWVDSDMVVMKNIDHLFDIEVGQDEILAAPGCRCNVFNNPKFDTLPHKCPYVNPNNTYINAGLLLIRPNIDVYNRLMKEDYNRPLVEQDVFSDYFASKINMLPATYNYMSQLDLIHPDVDSQDLHVFHFTYDKPWQKLGCSIHEKYYQYWRQLASEHKQSHIHI
jgi:lipopolysaccharide biosynthesis glycosyltransferase